MCSVCMNVCAENRLPLWHVPGHRRGTGLLDIKCKSVRGGNCGQIACVRVSTHRVRQVPLTAPLALCSTSRPIRTAYSFKLYSSPADLMNSKLYQCTDMWAPHVCGFLPWSCYQSAVQTDSMLDLIVFRPLRPLAGVRSIMNVP